MSKTRPRLQNFTSGTSIMNPETFHVVSIQVKSNALRRPYSHFASGSIIRRDLVLTSASAVYGHSQHPIKIVGGATRLNRGKTQESLATIIIHPNYDPQTNNKDIAILRLSTPLKLEEQGIGAISFAHDPAPRGTILTVGGWGNTDPPTEMEVEMGGRNDPEILKVMKVTICEDDKCGLFYKGLLTPGMMCAGTGKAPCYGDSGGPLARAHDCATSESTPGIYTNTIPLLQWVKEFIQIERPSTAKPQDVQTTSSKTRSSDPNYIGWTTNEVNENLFRFNKDVVRYDPGDMDPTQSVFHTAMWVEENPRNPSEGYKTGDHYWTVHFGELDTVGAWVGLSSLNRLKSGWATSGLFYGRNLSDGNSLILGNYGPSIKSGCVIGILVSFPRENVSAFSSMPNLARGPGQMEDKHQKGQGQGQSQGKSQGQGQSERKSQGQSEDTMQRTKSNLNFNPHSKTPEPKIRVYFFWNYQPLGLAFKAPVSLFPHGIHPCVAFNEGRTASTARIQKERVLPRIFDRPGAALNSGPSTNTKHQGVTVSGRKMESIEGYWRTTRNAVKLDNKDLAGSKMVTLKILMETESKLEDNLRSRALHCGVILRVVNTILFKIKAADKRGGKWTWERMSERPPLTTLLGSTPDLMKLESEVSALIQNPDTVFVGETRISKSHPKTRLTMTITKGNLSAIFQRHETRSETQAMCVGEEWCDAQYFT